LTCRYDTNINSNCLIGTTFGYITTSHSAP
jgi:hypothetical protein